MGQNVCETISRFFVNGTLEAGLNETLIVPIPKVPNPNSMLQLRPISLCKVIFKIVIKAIAKRIKCILPGLIHKTQSAFFLGKQILDNALLALNIFYSMKNRKKGSKVFLR